MVMDECCCYHKHMEYLVALKLHKHYLFKPLVLFQLSLLLQYLYTVLTTQQLSWLSQLEPILCKCQLYSPTYRPSGQNFSPQRTRPVHASYPQLSVWRTWFYPISYTCEFFIMPSLEPKPLNIISITRNSKT